MTLLALVVTPPVCVRYRVNSTCCQCNASHLCKVQGITILAVVGGAGRVQSATATKGKRARSCVRYQIEIYVLV